jgi:hypothetical protein
MLVQMPPQKTFCASMRGYAQDTFNGREPGVAPLNQAIAPGVMSEDAFLRFVGMVSTRDFGLDVDGNPYQMV